MINFRKILEEGPSRVLPMTVLNGGVALLGFLPVLPEARGEELIGGFVRFECSGGAESTDTVVSVPFRKSIAGTGRLESIVEQAADRAVLQLENQTFQADQFTGTPHHVRFTRGQREGWRFEIVENDSDSITIDLAGQSSAGLAVGDVLEVIEHWTLDSLFPPGEQTAFHESGGVLPVHRETELLFFDVTTTGIELSPDRVFFLTAEGWKRVEEGYPDAGSTVIPPGAGFVIRHPAGAADTIFVAHSQVDRRKVVHLVHQDAVESRDNTVSLVRPVPVSLADLDLEAVIGISASTAPGDRNDQLMVFETTSGTVNPLPARIYFRTGAGWVEDDGSNFPSAANHLIPAGAVLVVRKFSGGDGQSQVWLNTPRY